MYLYHGILEKNDQEGTFHFSSLKIGQRLSALPVTRECAFKKSALPSWIGQWHDRKPIQAVHKFQDTLLKIIRSANYLSDAISVVRQLHNTSENRQMAERASALDDIPLYLDMIWIYLRIHADVFATIAAYTYEETSQIPDTSFRRHRAWFLRNDDIDSEYARILSQDTGWFDVLAGKDPTGVRDILIHQRGTYQLHRFEAENSNDIEVGASLVRDWKIVAEDVIPLLVKVLSGYFSFLDGWTLHTVDRLSPHISRNLAPLDRPGPALFGYGRDAMPSRWLFPKILSENTLAA